MHWQPPGKPGLVWHVKYLQPPDRQHERQGFAYSPHSVEYGNLHCQERAYFADADVDTRNTDLHRRDACCRHVRLWQ